MYKDYLRQEIHTQFATFSSKACGTIEVADTTRTPTEKEVPTVRYS
jgi:hypothetical protein